MIKESHGIGQPVPCVAPLGGLIFRVLANYRGYSATATLRIVEEVAHHYARTLGVLPGGEGGRWLAMGGGVLSMAWYIPTARRLFRLGRSS